MAGLLGGLRRVQDAAVGGKTVLVRVDYNVPLRNGDVADDARIVASLPTVTLLLDRGAKVVLASHLGDPEGKVVSELRLDPVAARVQTLLGKPVRKLDDCIGEEVRHEIAAGAAGDVFLLENLRFHTGESANETAFARELASLADLYVNDAFAAIHRAHASTAGVPLFLPAYAGLLVQKEIEALSHLTDTPEHPYLAIVGGAKAKSKLGALRDLLPRVDALLLGGGTAFTFLRVREGNAAGVEPDLAREIHDLIRAAGEKGVRIVLPEDAVIAKEKGATAETEVCPATAIPSGWLALDIGPRSVELFRDEIGKAKTIVWTGPVGVFELAPFAAGTRAIAEALGASGAYTVVGGGETGEAIVAMGQADAVSFISTGGGACLALLRGKALPALEALRE